MTSLTEAQAQVLRHTGKTREQIVSLTGLSHHRVRAVRKELVELGLIERRLNREAGGRVCGWVYLPTQGSSLGTVTSEDIKQWLDEHKAYNEKVALADAEEVQRLMDTPEPNPTNHHALLAVIGTLCILAIGAVAWFAR